jgi:aspartate kinase
MLIVQKYGGSSVKNPERIQNVARRVVAAKRKGHQLVVVVSALGGETDRLIQLAHSIAPNPQDREMDMVLSTGEQISVALLAMAIHELGERAISFTGYQVGIMTDSSHTKARIMSIRTEEIKKALKDGNIVIVAGFQGVNMKGEITTLGRGGSDLTAVALAGALKSKCEIYTDVDGVYTTDPRLEPGAKRINEISYDEMLELASLGAKVMQSRSIEVAKKYNVPVWVKSSLIQNGKGTLICAEVKAMEDVLVRGVALAQNEAKITIFGVPDKPGVAARVFKTLADRNINVDMIIQNKTKTHYTDLTFTVFKSELKKATDGVKTAVKQVGAKGFDCDQNIAKISVVGVGMRSHSGVASKMFDVLAEARVNIQMISTSEIKISCVIDLKSGKKAVQALHKAFGLGKK